MPEVPCYNTLENWVRKCGLSELKDAPGELAGKEYAVVTDECMMVASDKLLPVIAIPAEHQGHPVQPSEARILSLGVSTGWGAKAISEAIGAATDMVGHGASYAVTDNESAMRNGVRLAGLPWHRDVSHTLAVHMERVYAKDPEFVEFTSIMYGRKAKFCMSPVARLQPPAARIKARFMNFGLWAEWALNMLQSFHQLMPQDREAYSYIGEHASFVEEMGQMAHTVRYIETQMKHHGLSRRVIDRCSRKVISSVMTGNERMRRAGQMMLDYLEAERAAIGQHDVLNNSSDIIESIFGIFKYIKSLNKLNGVTALVLDLPVMMRLSVACAARNYDVKRRLTDIKISHINAWSREKLSPNIVSQRIQTLNKLKQAC